MDLYLKARDFIAMKINKIVLHNWQAHENLELNFSDGLNIITGLSDTGKSSIRRAIDWICTNLKISENDFRRENSKETSVILFLDNEFEIERIRTDSINRYIIRKEGYEDKIFDNIGTSIPEEVKQILGMDLITIDKESLNLNIAQQLTLPFLLDFPASFRAKLFNKLTGNEPLDQTFQACNKEKLSINKEIQVLEENIPKQKEEIENCTKQYNALSEKLTIIKDLYSQIEEKIIIYDELKKLASKLKTNKEADDFIQFKLDKIIIISDNTLTNLRNNAITLTNLLSLSNRLNQVKINLQDIKSKEKIISEINFQDVKQRANNLSSLINLKTKIERNKEEQEKIDFLNSKINIPKVDFDILKEDNLMLNELSKLKNRLVDNKESNSKITLQLKNVKESSVKLEQQLKELWDKLDFCERCKPIVQRIFFGDKNAK